MVSKFKYALTYVSYLHLPWWYICTFSYLTGVIHKSFTLVWPSRQFNCYIKISGWRNLRHVCILCIVVELIEWSGTASMTGQKNKSASWVSLQSYHNTFFVNNVLFVSYLIKSTPFCPWPPSKSHDRCDHTRGIIYFRGKLYSDIPYHLIRLRPL